jgi:Protein of unknown function (DUF3486)
MTKRGRGWLSSIDLLPEAADPFIAQAMQDLRQRNKPQDQILIELNGNLADLGIKSITKSAFNRKSLWLASYGQQIENAREIASVMAERLDAAPEGDVGLLLNETLKTMIFDVLADASLSPDSASMKMLLQASESLMALERSRKLSVDTREQIETKFVKKASEAVDRVGKAKGLTSDTVTEIKRQILGIRLADPAQA